jgi:hypothetical protein
VCLEVEHGLCPERLFKSNNFKYLISCAPGTKSVNLIAWTGVSLKSNLAHILLIVLALTVGSYPGLSFATIELGCGDGVATLSHHVWMHESSAKVFHRAGYSPEHAELFRRFATEGGYYFLIRGRVIPKSIQDGKADLPKPLWIKMRSARKGKYKGYVVKPSAESFKQGHELELAELLWNEYWPHVSDKLTVNEDTGLVTDASGNRFISDYDLFGVFKASNGALVQFGDVKENSPTENRLWINRILTPGVKDPAQFLVQHGSLLEWLPLNKVTNRYLPVIYIKPNGTVGIITTHHELNDLMREIQSIQGAHQ